MAVSALLNFAALVLAGYFWPPLPAVPPPPAPKLLLLTLLPPTPRVKPPPRPKPPPKPPTPKRQPKVRATPLPPAPRQPVKVAPAASGGGSPKSRPSSMPKDASKFNKLAVNVADADVSQFLQTFLTDKPEQRHSDKGTAQADPNNKVKAGQGKSLDTTPPTQPGDAAGNGKDGTSPGAGGGPGNGLGRGGLGPFGITGKGGGGAGPRQVVYVLDISGSMDTVEQRFHGEERIDKAREELKAQVQSLSDGESFSIIVFSDEVRSFHPGLVSPTKDTVQEAFRFLDEQEPHDATDLERALTTALAMPGVNLIYVITDGVPWPPGEDKYESKDFPALAERIRKSNVNRIPIYTIGLLGPNPDGTDDSPEASALLTRLAHDSGGRFKDVKLDGEKP